MKLSEMRQLLNDRGIRLTKALGQNFLHDGNQLRRIVAAAGLSGADRVLEIGPGLGPMTELLLASGGAVLAIEKDARLVAVLRERFAHQASLTLEHADALKWLRTHQDWGGWKVVSNLPYSVASPLLVELAQAPAGPERIVVTVQWEVARRIMAQAGHADYGLLTLLLQLDYAPGACFKIPGSCFHPAPDVESACLVLDRKSGSDLNAFQRAAFRRLVKRAFGQRRKMMFKLLKADWPEPVLQRAFAELELSPGVRAEAVTLEQFVRLTRALTTTSGPA